MKKIIPSIRLNNCKDALDFYNRIFGGEVKNLQTAEANEMFKGHEGKIVHSELHINSDCILHLNDFLNDKSEGNQISLMLEMESKDEIERLFSELSKGGKVAFELQKAFWGAYHAVLTDKFGITWSLNFRES